MTDSPSAKTWIITGAARGFGRAIAIEALNRGDRVVAAVRSPDSLADLAKTHSNRFVVERCDAADADQIGGLVEVAVERFGRLDVVVNNAGRAIVGAAEEVSDTQLRALMDLHLFAPAALVREALPVMRRQGTGAIIQMSS